MNAARPQLVLAQVRRAFAMTNADVLAIRDMASFLK